MANAKSHHLNNIEQHVLVATDQQPREASYTTTDEDGTTRATVHMLWYDKNPKAADGRGEVRSTPIEDWPKPTQPIYEPPETAPFLAAVPLTWDGLVGTDASALPDEAYLLLRSHGGVGKDGKVLAVEAWGKR